MDPFWYNLFRGPRHVHRMVGLPWRDMPRVWSKEHGSSVVIVNKESKALIRLSLPNGDRHRCAPDPVAGRKNEKSAPSALPFRHYLTITFVFISILYPPTIRNPKLVHTVSKRARVYAHKLGILRDHGLSHL